MEMPLGFWFIGGENGVRRCFKKEKYESKRVSKLGCLFS
ncbi:hypothetical protein bcere0028_48090 [Bacillus cereus AH1271]|nr:hypothetical protein bcere0028_48090 [Bacillus cereus AH1271]